MHYDCWLCCRDPVWAALLRDVPSQAETEELAQLREKVRTQKSSTAQYAKEAKLMESRALQLAAEVDRVKELLLVRVWGGCHRTVSRALLPCSTRGLR